MAHFPIFIELSRRKCMIFGGGKVACRKAEILLQHGARVEVFSLEVLPRLCELLPEEMIHLQDISVMGEDTLGELIGPDDLVIAATDNRMVNLFIGSWCRDHHILVNVIDAPEECSFLFPSVVKKGDISIGINSDGKSPVVSKKIRQEIEEMIPDYYGDIARQLGQLKLRLKESCPDASVRKAILKKAGREAFLRERVLTEEELEDILS